jgi:hypothetical protein
MHGHACMDMQRGQELWMWIPDSPMYSSELICASCSLVKKLVRPRERARFAMSRAVRCTRRASVASRA